MSADSQNVTAILIFDYEHINRCQPNCYSARGLFPDCGYAFHVLPIRVRIAADPIRRRIHPFNRLGVPIRKTELIYASMPRGREITNAVRISHVHDEHRVVNCTGIFIDDTKHLRRLADLIFLSEEHISQRAVLAGCSKDCLIP